MKLASAIEGGLMGASTLSLLQEALHKIDSKSPRPLLYKSGLLKKLKARSVSKKDTRKIYIQLAGEVLSNAALFGLTGLGKKKNSVLRGGLLGFAAGLSSVLLTDEDDTDIAINGDKTFNNKNNFKNKLLTMGLYTAGGLLAGVAVKKFNLKKLKKRKK